MTNNSNITGSRTFDDCYSSFAHPRDVIANEGPFDTSSSSVYDDRRLPSFAINGFFCYSYELAFFSKHLRSNGPIEWWMVNLNRVVAVESIIVVPTPGDFFNNIIVRLGNNNNYANNEKVFTVKENPEPRMPFTIELPFGKSGQYLSFESDNIIFLAIGSVQIIENK